MIRFDPDMLRSASAYCVLTRREKERKKNALLGVQYTESVGLTVFIQCFKQALCPTTPRLFLYIHDFCKKEDDGLTYTSWFAMQDIHSQH